jgi:hypothetical protein
MKRLGVVAVVAAALFLSACGTTGKAEVVGSTTPTTTDDGSGGTTRRPTTTTRPSSDAAVTVTEVGMTAAPDRSGDLLATAGAVLTNTSRDDAVMFEVIFTFKDEAGRPVGTDTTYVNAISAGQKGYAAVDGVELQGTPTTVEAVPVVENDRYTAYVGTMLPTQVTSLAEREYVGLVVAGTVTNTGDQVLKSAEVVCVLRRGGTVIGGVDGYLDTLTPGASAAWDATLYSVPVVADAAECSASHYGRT